MSPATLSTAFAAGFERLLLLIARHGHLRRVAGPLVVLIWQSVRSLSTQVAGLFARMQAGTLRRHPARRKPRPSSRPRRRRRPNPLAGRAGWLVHLLPELAEAAGNLHALLADPQVPALLHAAPQLRRRLTPLCHMLGVRLPPPPSPPPPSPPLPSPSAPPTPSDSAKPAATPAAPSLGKLASAPRPGPVTLLGPNPPPAPAPAPASALVGRRDPCARQ